MFEFAFRLQKGADLKESIENICLENNFNTAIVLSSVGCLYEANFRLAKAVDYYSAKQDFEILCLNGTISKGKAHLHIALADEKGNVVGGHLQKGCLINTTCELVLAVLEEYESSRTFDEKTGYDEIIFKKKV